MQPGMRTGEHGIVHDLAHVCAGVAWLCSVQNAGKFQKSRLARTARHLHGMFCAHGTSHRAHRPGTSDTQKHALCVPVQVLHACRRQSIGGGRRPGCGSSACRLAPARAAGRQPPRRRNRSQATPQRPAAVASNNGARAIAPKRSPRWLDTQVCEGGCCPQPSCLGARGRGEPRGEAWRRSGP